MTTGRHLALLSAQQNLRFWRRSYTFWVARLKLARQRQDYPKVSEAMKSMINCRKSLEGVVRDTRELIYGEPQASV